MKYHPIEKKMQSVEMDSDKTAIDSATESQESSAEVIQTNIPFIISDSEITLPPRPEPMTVDLSTEQQDQAAAAKPKRRRARRAGGNKPMARRRTARRRTATRRSGRVRKSSRKTKQPSTTMAVAQAGTVAENLCKSCGRPLAKWFAVQWNISRITLKWTKMTKQLEN